MNFVVQPIPNIAKIKSKAIFQANHLKELANMKRIMQHGSSFYKAGLPQAPSYAFLSKMGVRMDVMSTTRASTEYIC